MKLRFATCSSCDSRFMVPGSSTSPRRCRPCAGGRDEEQASVWAYPARQALRTSWLEDGPLQSPDELDVIGRIGPYELLRELARGGMGVVWLAWDPERQRPAALKLTLAGAFASDLERSRFLREARCAAALDHPGVVAVYDYGEVDGQAWFAMELVAGPSLRELFESSPELSIEEVTRIGIEVADALSAAHQAGLIHRDIKPANLLLRCDGTVVITDFGLARSLDEGSTRLTRTGAVFGTPAYMSPEQARGEREAIGAATDIYALGAVLFELLTGSPPVEGETELSVLLKVAAGEIRSARSLSPTLPLSMERVLSCALAYEPRERYPTASDLAADLRRVRARQRVLARRPPVHRRAARWAARHRRPLVAALATALLGATALLVVSAVRGRVQRDQERVREQEAGVAAEAVLERLRDLRVGGELARANELLQVFSQNWPGTAAASAAWRRHGTALVEEGSLREAWAPLAAALQGAQRSEQADAARVELAALSLLTGRWPTAQVALSRISPGASAELLTQVAVLQARLYASTGQISLAITALRDQEDPEALALLPLVQALRGRQQTALSASQALSMGMDPSGARTLLLSSSERWTLVEARPSLPVLKSSEVASLRPLSWRSGPEGDRVLAARALDGPEEEYELVELHWEGEAPTFTRRLVLGELPAAGTAWADLDGDGSAELYQGLGPTGRALLRLDPTPTSWVATRPFAPLQGPPQGSNSDVEVVAALDFDQDGGLELWVGTGPWSSYDLRQLEPTATGLESRWRWKGGSFTGLVAAGTLAGQPLAGAIVSLERVAPNRRAFAQEVEQGEASALAVLRPGASGPEIISRLRPPLLGDRAGLLQLRQLGSGDLDGDGSTDLVVALGSSEGSVCATWALRRTGPDSFVSLVIDGRRPLLLQDIDQDGDDELVAATCGDEPLVEIYGLGEGDEQTAAPPLLPRRELPTGLGFSGELARRWQAAQELEDMNLWEAAATAWLAVEVATTLDALALQALAAAARATLQAGDPAGAIELYEQVIKGRQGGSGAALHPEDQRLLAEARSQALLPLELSSDQDLVIDPRRPLDPAWQIEEAGLLERDEAAGLLRVRTTNGRDGAATLPVYWFGGPLLMEAELDVLRTEWSGALHIDLQSGDNRILGLEISSGGGGGWKQRRVSCGAPRGARLEARNSIIQRATDRERLWVELRVDPVAGRAACLIENLDTGLKSRSYSSFRPQSIGPAGVLRISGGGSSGLAAQVVIGLRRLRVLGATVGDAAASDPLQVAHRMLADGNPAEALSLLSRQTDLRPEVPLARALALSQVGWTEDAAQQLNLALQLDDPSAQSAEPGEWQGSTARRTIAALARDPELGQAGLLRRSLPPMKLAQLLRDGIDMDLYDGNADNRRAIAQATLALLVLDRAGLEAIPLHHQLTFARGGAELAAGEAQAAFEDLSDVDPSKLDPLDRPRRLTQLAQALVALGREAEAQPLALQACRLSPTPELVVDRLLTDPLVVELVQRGTWSSLPLSDVHVGLDGTARDL